MSPCLLTPAAGAVLQPAALGGSAPGMELVLLCSICLGPVGGAAPSYGWGQIVVMVQGGTGVLVPAPCRILTPFVSTVASASSWRLP